MTNGYFAVYLGKEYTSHASRKGEKLLLRSSDLKDIDRGFELCKPFKYKKYKEQIVCIKKVYRSEVEAYYKLTTYAYYKGYKF